MKSRKEALKVMPKKPLNAYFRFRKDKLYQYKDDPNRCQLVKQAWEALTQNDKKGLDDAYRIEIKQYRHDFEKWKEEYGIEPDFQPSYRQMADISKKESMDDKQKFAVFKKESSDCFLRLNKQIKDQLMQRRSEFADLSDNQANRYIQEYQQLCNDLQETIYNESNLDSNNEKKKE